MQRHPKNPIITRWQIPEILPSLKDVTSVFNPGAIKFDDKILLMLRVQNRARETFLVMAESADGINFRVDDKIIHWQGIEKVQDNIFHIYDPRITKIENEYFIMFAMDMASGCRLGLGKTSDFKSFEFVGIVSREDNRNGVLFPEKIGGKFLRLDRPNQTQLENGPLTGSSIQLSESEDLLIWKPVCKLIDGRPHYWDELIGAGSPPLKTKQGWLCLYHGITRHFQPIYQAGVMLLDLENPAKIIARGRYNILEPRELYETVGQVPNVVFPTGIIADEYDEKGFAEPESKVSIYYGAADTSVCLAVSNIREMILNCLES